MTDLDLIFMADLAVTIVYDEFRVPPLVGPRVHPIEDLKVTNDKSGLSTLTAATHYIQCKPSCHNMTDLDVTAWQIHL